MIPRRPDPSEPPFTRLSSANPPPASRPSPAVALTILLALFAYYLALFLRYRPYDVDNPWFLSFSYNTFVEHISTDQFLNVPFPGGMDGTQLFGRLAAATQFLFLSPFNWQQRPAVLVSSLFVVLALACWWLQLRKLGYKSGFLTCFLVIAGLSEPFLSVANKFRYEFLSFAMLSAALLLVSLRRPLLGAFLAALAVEVQPIALAGLIPIFVLAASLEKLSLRLAARLLGGMLLALPIYFALHPHAIATFQQLARSPGAAPAVDGGYFVAYFIRRPRHYPELLCFLAAGVLYWRRRHSFPSHYLGISALLLTLYSFAMPHGNTSYMVFSYPFLVGMLLEAMNADRRPGLIVAAVLLVTLPQDLYLIHLTRNMGFRTTDIAQVSGAIARAETSLNLPDKSLRIYGDYRLWFAHPHFYRAASLDTVSYIQDADLYLCLDAPADPDGLKPLAMFYCSDLQARVPLRLLDTVQLRNSRVFLYARP